MFSNLASVLLFMDRSVEVKSGDFNNICQDHIQLLLFVESDSHDEIQDLTVPGEGPN